MGTFCEAVLAFHFRDDVPEPILRAFAAWQLPGSGLEPLETSEVDLLERGPQEFESDEEFAAMFCELFVQMDNAYLSGTPGTVLANVSGRWSLTTRLHQKMCADQMAEFLERLGRWACPGATVEEPEFIGYIRTDSDEMPTLVWHRGRDRFEFDGPAAPLPPEKRVTLPEPAEEPRSKTALLVADALPSQDDAPPGFVVDIDWDRTGPMWHGAPLPRSTPVDSVRVHFAGRVEGGRKEVEIGFVLDVWAFNSPADAGEAYSAANEAIAITVQSTRRPASLVPLLDTYEAADECSAGRIEFPPGDRSDPPMTFAIALRGVYVLQARARLPIDIFLSHSVLDNVLQALPG